MRLQRVSASIGGSVAVDGLLQEINQESTRKVQFLGDLPLVWLLFRSNSSQSDTRETMVFILPHILDEQRRFSGPLLLDRLSEVQLAHPEEGVAPPQAGTEAQKGVKKRTHPRTRQTARGRRAAET